mmetsp:Transcript_65723/g.155240  ORF Transcript_65723/g.155240 Transcript_65723/m.155240 type:complete len:255 (-) Transcript_65723:109-873(-)
MVECKALVCQELEHFQGDVWLVRVRRFQRVRDELDFCVFDTRCVEQPGRASQRAVVVPVRVHLEKGDLVRLPHPLVQPHNRHVPGGLNALSWFSEDVPHFDVCTRVMQNVRPCHFIRSTTKHVELPRIDFCHKRQSFCVGFVWLDGPHARSLGGGISGVSSSVSSNINDNGTLSREHSIKETSHHVRSNIIESGMVLGSVSFRGATQKVHLSQLIKTESYVSDIVKRRDCRCDHSLERVVWWSINGTAAVVEGL